jgi:threonine dehydrogenase-like Zn-dependent dehydrogenase
MPAIINFEWSPGLLCFYALRSVLHFAAGQDVWKGIAMAKAIILDKAGSAKLIEREVSPPAEGQIAIRSELSLVSAGTERTQVENAPSYPLEPGYATVGQITAIGGGVPGLSVGDRVFAQMAHASEAVIDHRFAVPVPEGVSSQDAAFTAVGAMANYAVRQGQAKLGDPLLILGQGLIGLIATQIARVSGAMPITVVDIAEKRLDLGRRFGADRTFLASDDALPGWLADLCGGGPAVSIILSGAASALETAVAATRRGGRIVTGALVPQGQDVNVYGRVWLEGISIVGSYFNARPYQLNATETTSPYDWPISLYDAGRYVGDNLRTGRDDFVQFLQLLRHDRVHVSDLIDETVDAQQAPEMFMGLPSVDTLGHIIRWR